MFKDSFLLYQSDFELFEILSEADRGILITALMKFVFERESPEFSSDTLKMAFMIIKRHIDRDSQKYLNVCNRNRQNGLKGGRPKITELHSNPNNPLGFLETQGYPVKAEPSPLPSAEFSLECENKNITCFSFEEFWNMYDRKIERKKCEKIYAKIPESTRAIIKEKLPLYINSTPEIQYRKHPQTWLNNECWNDETRNQPQQRNYMGI